MLRSLLLLAACAAPLRAFPDGAPAEACLRGMTPNHGGARSQEPRSLPFVITRQTHPGGVTVQVQAVGNASLKGFLIQARDAQTGKPAHGLGSWADAKNVKQLPECVAVTHADRKKKTSVNVAWEGRQDVNIVATLLQSYSVFWVGVQAVEQPVAPRGPALSGSGPSSGSAPGFGAPFGSGPTQFAQFGQNRFNTFFNGQHGKKK